MQDARFRLDPPECRWRFGNTARESKDRDPREQPSATTNVADSLRESVGGRRVRPSHPRGRVGIRGRETQLNPSRRASRSHENLRTDQNFPPAVAPNDKIASIPAGGRQRRRTTPLSAKRTRPHVSPMRAGPRWKQPSSARSRFRQTTSANSSRSASVPRTVTSTYGRTASKIQEPDDPSRTHSPPEVTNPSRVGFTSDSS